MFFASRWAVLVPTGVCLRLAVVVFLCFASRWSLDSPVELCPRAILL
jgi:hypothetical protein